MQAMLDRGTGLGTQPRYVLGYRGGSPCQSHWEGSGDQEDEQFDEDYDNISHLSKFSLRRHRDHQAEVAAAELQK